MIALYFTLELYIHHALDQRKNADIITKKSVENSMSKRPTVTSYILGAGTNASKVPELTYLQKNLFVRVASRCGLLPLKVER